MKSAIIYILIIVCGCLYLLSQKPVKVVSSLCEPQTPQIRVLSPRELQQHLNSECDRLRIERYRVVEDGIIGKDTIEKWKRYCCDQYYKRSTYGNGNMATEMAR